MNRNTAPTPRSGLRTLLFSAGITVLVIFCLLGAGFAALVVRELITTPEPTATPLAAAPTRVPSATPRPPTPTPRSTATARPTATPATPVLPALRDVVQQAYRHDDGPIDVVLTHALNDTIKSRLANVDPQRDLTVRATMVNPYSAADAPFDFGFIFRSAPGVRYNIDLFSDASYRLDLVRDGQWIEVVRGPLTGLRLAAGERNAVELEVSGSTGVLTVNGTVQARLNLADHQLPGSVSVAIGLYTGNEREGAETLVEDFSVRGRDEPTALNVELRETFVSADTGFALGPYSDRNGLLERAVADGVYRWTYRTLAATFIRTEAPTNLANDFALAANVRVVDAQADDGSPLAVKTGLAVRLVRDADGNLSHYLFQVAADGSRASFFLYRNGEWTELLSVADPPVRRGDINQLAVIARGQRYRCFVNGTEVLSLSHFTLSGGLAALTVEVGGAGTATVEFDEVEVRVGP